MVEIDQDKRGSNQLTGASPGFSFGKALSCENNYDDNWRQGCYRQGCHLVKLDRRWKELNVWHLTSIMIIVIIVMMMMIVKTTSSWWPPAREDSALQSTTGMNLFAPGVHFYGSSRRALYVREVSMKKAGLRSKKNAKRAFLYPGLTMSRSMFSPTSSFSFIRMQMP